MRPQKLSFLFILLVLLGGCATTSTDYFLQPGRSLDGFRFVYIYPLKYEKSGDDIWGIGTRIANSFSRKGFRVIGSQNDLLNLSPEEYGQVLFCKISHTYSWRDATCTIELHDCRNEKVYNSIGKYQQKSLMIDQDTRGELVGAADEAFKPIEGLYRRFDASLAFNPIDDLKKQTAKWEQLNYDEAQLRTYYDQHASELDPLEGIWTSLENDNQYRIGIIRDKNSTTRDFAAIIIQADHKVWQPKQVKIEFQKTIYGKTYTTTYYMSDFSRQGTTSYITDSGVLEIPLKDPNNKDSKASWIKNYPTTDARSAGPFGSSEADKSASSGTGFLLTHSGIVITNWHVVKGNDNIQICFPSCGKTYKATVSLKDAGNDLAVLKLAQFSYSKHFTTDIPYKVAATKLVKTGQEVFTLGFPLGDILGTTAKLSSGTVSSVFGIKDDPRLMQISNPIQPGNSGGPLFSRNGDIVGIVVASLNARYFFDNADIMPQNVNFAVKSDYLINLTSMLTEGDELQTRRNRLSGLTLEKQVELVTPFIVTIRAK
jgi:S1-C subfamily serine protease